MMLFVWILALAGATAAPGDCPAPADGEYRQAGLEAFRAGEERLAGRLWDEAAERFAAAARLDPLFPLAPYGLGQAHMGAQRYAGAVQAFAQSRDAFRCLASASAADRADAQKQVDGAIRELRDVLRNVEREEMLRSSIPRKEVNNLPTGNLGDALLQAQRIEGVLRELESAKRQLARAEVPAEVYQALGNAYFQSGSLPDAEREFLTALRTDPRSGDVQNNLAVVYMLTGRLDEAEQAVKRAEKAGVPVDPASGKRSAGGAQGTSRVNSTYRTIKEGERMRLVLRVVALAAVLFVLLPVAAGVTGVSAPAPGAAVTPPAHPAGMEIVAPVLFCVLAAAVLSWMIVKSTLFGARLVAAVFLAHFGLGTFMLQIESVVFLPRHLPPGFVNRLFAMGALIALVAAPAAVWIHGRFRSSRLAGRAPNGIPSTPGGWALRLAGLAAAYVALYFLAGYFIAYRNPDVLAYYDDSDAGSFLAALHRVWMATPWLFALQALRGVLWVACVIPFVVSFRGRAWELPLLVGCAFSVWLVMLLAPNPYMPESVRMSHLAETVSSNFVFGCIVGASFVRSRERRSLEAVTTGV